MTTPYRGRAPRVNPEDAPIPVPREFRVNVKNLAGPPKDRPDHAGVIPERGVYSSQLWAEFYEVDRRTIERWVRKYKVPHTTHGGMKINALHFVPLLPLVTFSDTETTDESEA